MNQFWMVYVEESNHGPEYKHETLASARTEAARLCAVRGKPTYVLKAMSVCQPVVKWLDLFSVEEAT